MLESRAIDLLPNVLEQNTDFCYMVSNITNPRIITIPISEERIQLFISRQLLYTCCSDHYNEIINNPEKIYPIKYFSNCPLAMQAATNRVRITCEEIFEKNNIKPNIIFTSTNSMNLLKFAEQGIGAAFLTSSTALRDNSVIQRLNIQELPQHDILKACYLKDHYLSKPAKRFIELSKNILSQHIPQPI